MVRSHLKQHHFQEKHSVKDNEDNNKASFLASRITKILDEAGADKIPKKIGADDRLHDILGPLGKVIIIYTIIAFSISFGFQLSDNISARFINLSGTNPTGSTCNSVPSTLNGKYAIDVNGNWETFPAFNPALSISSVNFQSFKGDAVVYKSTLNELKSQVEAMRDRVHNLPRFHIFAFASTAQYATADKTMELSFTADPSTTSYLLSPYLMNMLASSNVTDTRYCTLATNGYELEFENGVLSITEIPILEGELSSEPIPGCKVWCRNILSSDYIYKPVKQYYSQYVYTKLIDPLNITKVGDIITKSTYQYQSKWQVQMKLGSFFVAMAVNEGFISIKQLNEIPSSALLQFPWRTYQHPRLKGKVVCNTLNGTDYCLATWGISGSGNLALPLIYTLSLNPRSGSNASLCDCSINRTNPSQRYCDAVNSGSNNFGIGALFINIQGLPVRADWASQANKFVTYIQKAGNYSKFLSKAYPAFKVGNNDKYQPIDFDDSWPSSSQFQEIFDFCDGECSVMRSVAYAVDTSISSNSFILTNSCSTSILMNEQAWEKALQTPPVPLVEGYSECKNTFISAASKAAGVSVGLMNLLVAALIYCLLPIGVFLYLRNYTEWNDNHYYFGDRYSHADVQEALDELGLHILRIRDDDLAGVKEDSKVKALSLDLLEVATATYNLAANRNNTAPAPLSSPASSPKSSKAVDFEMNRPGGSKARKSFIRKRKKSLFHQPSLDEIQIESRNQGLAPTASTKNPMLDVKEVSTQL